MFLLPSKRSFDLYFFCGDASRFLSATTSSPVVALSPHCSFGLGCFFMGSSDSPFFLPKKEALLCSGSVLAFTAAPSSPLSSINKLWLWSLRVAVAPLLHKGCGHSQHHCLVLIVCVISHRRSTPLKAGHPPRRLASWTHEAASSTFVLVALLLLLLPVSRRLGTAFVPPSAYRTLRRLAHVLTDCLIKINTIITIL